MKYSQLRKFRDRVTCLGNKEILEFSRKKTRVSRFFLWVRGGRVFKWAYQFRDLSENKFWLFCCLELVVFVRSFLPLTQWDVLLAPYLGSAGVQGLFLYGHVVTMKIPLISGGWLTPKGRPNISGKPQPVIGRRTPIWGYRPPASVFKCEAWACLHRHLVTCQLSVKLWGASLCLKIIEILP